MKKLTKKEEEIMQFFWKKGKAFVKEIVKEYPDPKPHYNTISTMVRILENKGFLGYEAFGKTHRYYPLISKEEYNKLTLKNVISNYFGNSYKNVVSLLVEEEYISIDELKQLIKTIEDEQKPETEA